MNMKTVVILLILALATIFALVCVLLTRKENITRCGSSRLQNSPKGAIRDPSQIFADLTADEIAQVVKYLKDNLGVHLEDAFYAKPSNNCIYYLDTHLPPKAQVLGFLDHGRDQPPRQASAVVYFGDQPDPNITEFVVGPLPNPTYHRDITRKKFDKKVPYHSRPVTEREYRDIDLLIFNELSSAPIFLKECCEYNGTNLATLTTAPRGFESGDRATWFVLFQNVVGSGYYIHPVGLEVLVNHSSLNICEWKVEKVFYNGHYYQDPTHLEREFRDGRVKEVRVKAVQLNDFPLRKPLGSPVHPGPFQFEPQGIRYTVTGSHVAYQSWKFAFGMNVNTGPRLFNIRFGEDRIVYELSLQEALATYGSNCPGGMVTRYMDGSLGIGKFAYELVRGVDCPYMATYVDRYYLIDSDIPKLNKNSFCIFEHDMGVPLRRHFSDMGSFYYEGLAKYALVLRAISTLINYDYVWDFVFYQNGAIEVKVHATGYISSSFLMDGGTSYGNRVGEHTLGTMHNHLMNYKVDLDVGGTKNTLVALDMAFESVPAPWSPEHQIHRPVLTRRILDSEEKAAFPLDGKVPRYLHFATSRENQWNHQRGYRIQIVSFAGDHLPEASTMEKSISWGRYKLAVTKRKEEEMTSTCIYNQNDPWDPLVVFADFINNETIINEDLVAWISTGFLHVPHSEDIPNTVTVGNGVGFFLRPYNFFDFDPSINSPDGVSFTADQDASKCDINQAACLQKTASCSHSLPPYTYSGFQNLTSH
ncbi:membrane primary amine oxidase-like isoform X1 [Rhineura floridana]|uniref:membrane primary amine oxidase-like isoform X1 n=2 Tax=Rhineura floridana TaxID=261503 RepID=UPI002AC85503|nr:membrane primary amine oxidase-like isoform X1 [Rhineura floridana]